MRITAHTPLPLKNIVAQEVEKVERQTIGQALDASSGNKAKAARMLQIDYKTMQSKVKRYGISQNKNNHYENQEASL
jgi:two-component system nitrogen regulation response regulator GlnG